MSSRRRNDSSSRAEPEFDVTGVSRSGRVRKKSSKLIDYEGDEPETRKRRTSTIVKSPVTPTVKPLRLNLTQLQITPSSSSSTQRKSPIIKPDDSPSNFSKLSPDFPEDQLVSQDLKDESSIEEEESEEENEGDETSDEDFDRESPVESRKTAVRAPSVYLMEKSNKKRLIIQDGKVVGKAKAERKDKGQSRFTAYMLWAKEMRPKIAKENPDIDFSAVSKRLGELWASVSQTERNNLKRRALRMSGKAVSGGMISTGKPAPTPKLTAVKQTATPSVPATPTTSAPPPSKVKKSPVSAKPVEELDDKTLALLRGTEPLDVAAHLHLLGQSLTAVGARLQEHQGQIAVSGSWSVLLDSVLCAIGPLLCLTQKVPELDVIPAPTLAKMLENIALITPGL